MRVLQCNGNSLSVESHRASTAYITGIYQLDSLGHCLPPVLLITNYALLRDLTLFYTCGFVFG